MIKVRVNKSDDTERLANIFHIHPSVMQAIINRGYASEDDIDTYLNPDTIPYGDPYQINDMEKAVSIILDAIKSNKKIVVFGDTDCDGIVGTAILVCGLRELSNNIEYTLTNRNAGGAYGLGPDSAERVLAMEPDLVITVDNGTTSIEGIEILRAQNIKVIVTDHHEQLAESPNVEAMVNPKVGNRSLSGLCGAGVAWYLLRAIASKNDKLKPDRYLDLVAVATIGDVVPLRDQNRRIVYDGLKNMHKTKNVGLAILLKQCGLFKKVTSGDIGFKVAPIINAFGRVGDPMDGVALFIEQNKTEATVIATHAKSNNMQRKEIEADIYKAALLKLVKGPIPAGVFLYDPGWDGRVAGIVAGKLAQRYRRPAFIMTKITDPDTGKVFIKGSCRSIEGVDMVLLLSAVDEHLNMYGGHKMAAGFTLDEDKLDAFIEAASEFIERVSNIVDIEVVVDAEANISDISWDFVNQQERMQPFGFQNKEPTFLFKDVRMVDSKVVGTCHLSCNVMDFSHGKLKAIMFNSPYTKAPNHLVDIVGTIKISKWRGNEDIQLFIKEVIDVG